MVVFTTQNTCSIKDFNSLKRYCIVYILYSQAEQNCYHIITEFSSILFVSYLFKYHDLFKLNHSLSCII